MTDKRVEALPKSKYKTHNWVLLGSYGIKIYFKGLTEKQLRSIRVHNIDNDVFGIDVTPMPRKR